MKENARKMFNEYLARNHRKTTHQRNAILETFLETDGHFSAEEFSKEVAAKAPEIGTSTVYRALKLFLDCGIADSIDLGTGSILYENIYGRRHHDHLVCIRCNKKVEFFDEGIEQKQKQLAKQHGFTLTKHQMNLFGLCPACRQALKPLSYTRHSKQQPDRLQQVQKVL